MIVEMPLILQRIMNLESTLQSYISKALKAQFNADVPENQVHLQPTKKEFKGTYTLVTFPLTKISGKSPEETARLIGGYLKLNASEISGYNVVKGFLNLEIADHAWLNTFKTIVETKKFGKAAPKSEKIMVEYSSPNTNKPLHLGHLRNNFLGYSVAQILAFNGYEVVKANLVNDRGIHICKSMLAYLKFGHGETPESSGIKGDHLIGDYYVLFDKEYKKQIEALKQSGLDEETAKKKAQLIVEAQEMLQKWEQGDKETVALWQKMNAWVYAGFDETYKKMGVDFDQFYYESQTYLLGKDIVEEGLQKAVFFKKDDGSVWCDLMADGYDQKLVQRADGTSVYITQDLGTADLKYKDHKVDKSIYVIGNEQDYHMAILFLIMKKLGRPYGDGMYHLSYGMVDLPTGRMKSREGTVVDADDLIQEMVDTAQKTTTELGKIEGFSKEEAGKLYNTLGLGALKYFLLKVDPKKKMIFNPEESIEFQGNTGPFIQYTHARIKALVRRASQLEIPYKAEDFLALQNLHETEASLIYMLSQFPSKVDEASRAYSPAVIANYTFDLAKEYNKFYQEVSIFNEQDKQALSFRISCSAMVAEVIASAMKLLGIEVPEKM